MINTLPHLALMPSQILMGLAILIFFLGKTLPVLRDKNPLPLFLTILVTCFMIEVSSTETQTLFFEMIKVDSYGRLFNQIFLIVLAITALMITQTDEIDRKMVWETYGLFSTIGLGMMLMASAVNLLIAVIAIELVSLPSYILVAMNRKNGATKEAALKYVLFGSFATGIMLYGASLLFGLSGSLVFAKIWQGLAVGGILGTPLYFLAIMMTLAGMVFKIAAAPFHFWCPDAYQAAPTPVTAFLSVAPKMAGLALIMRFFADHISSQTTQLSTIISVIAMVTMSIGNLAALHQKDIKRMLAYSSISHAGFLLIGVAAMNQAGREAVFFYIPVYLLMNLGAFMAVIYLSKGEEFQITAFKGIIKEKPLLVVGLAACLFSLAGLPPFAGFIGKFYLFKVAIESQLYALVLVAGINSVVSLWYYLNILKIMIIDEVDTSSQGIQLPAGTVPITFVTVCAVPLLFFGVYWVPLLNWVAQVQIFQ